jgi:hypothetical protein
MLAIRVGDDVYELSAASFDELARRLEPTSAPLERGEPAADSIQDKLRDAIHSRQPAELHEGHLALVGVVLEAWAVEGDADLPADVQDLRHAIAARLR